MIMPDSFVIWGSAGHAKVLADLLLTRGDRVLALFDNQPVLGAVPGVPLYVGLPGFAQWWSRHDARVPVCGAVAIGHCTPARLDILALFKSHGLRVPPIVHPQASVCLSARLGEGVQVLAQSVVSAEAVVGDACIINHRASVDHECVLGAGVHVAPGATLCGEVVVADHVFIGAGAVLLPRVQIGAGAVIGAGALVTSDVPAAATVVGVPAKVIQPKEVL